MDLIEKYFMIYVTIKDLLLLLYNHQKILYLEVTLINLGIISKNGYKVNKNLLYFN